MTPQESFESFLDRTCGPLPTGEGEPTPEGRPPIVQDDAMADRILQRLAHLQREMEENIASYTDMLTPLTAFYYERKQPLDAWLEEQNGAKRHAIARLEMLLVDYYDQLKAQGKVYKPKRRQSHTPYALPHGTMEAYVVREE